MNYYIKQKVFSFGDQFTVKNTEGKDLFYVEGKFLSMPKVFKLYDFTGQELVRIESVLWTLLPKYKLFIGGKELASIHKSVNFFKNNYEIEGLNWRIEGDFTAHEYKIFENNEIIAEISKVYFSWADTYEISIEEDDYTDVILGIVIAIDAAIAATESNN